MFPFDDVIKASSFVKISCSSDRVPDYLIVINLGTTIALSWRLSLRSSKMLLESYFNAKRKSRMKWSPEWPVRTWWRHQIETFSALLALWARNSSVTGEFPAQRPVKQSFDAFFALRLDKRLSKQSWGWWFGTPSPPLWRNCNDIFFLANTFHSAPPTNVSCWPDGWGRNFVIIVYHQAIKRLKQIGSCDGAGVCNRRHRRLGDRVVGTRTQTYWYHSEMPSFAHPCAE